MGFTDSDSVLAIGPQFQKAGIPFITPGATSPKLPDQLGDDVFLACFGDNVQAAAGAEFVLKQAERQERLSAARQLGTEYTTLLSQYFADAFDHGGGKIVRRGHLQDRRQVLHRADHQDQGAGAASPTSSTSRRCRTISAWSSSRCARPASPCRSSAATATTRRCCSQVGGEAPTTSTSPRTPSWARTHAGDQGVLKAYKKAYGTPPENAFAALGYDTVGLIADAIKRAGSADPAKIRDALAATQATGRHRHDHLPPRHPGSGQDRHHHRRQRRQADAGLARSHLPGSPNPSGIAWRAAPTAPVVRRIATSDRN